MDELDRALEATTPEARTSVSTVRERPAPRPVDPERARRGRQSRNYGNRAELDVARRYGGTKVGHAGGPVDVRGRDWNTQVKTHRRQPPREWVTVFAKLEASTDRLPRLLLRFVMGPGVPPQDYIVIPGKAWLDWFGRDEEENAA